MLVNYQGLTSDYYTAIFTRLSILDRLLTPAILVCMIMGVVIGEFAPHVQEAFNTARLDGVSVRE
jgi:ACR3 family arsenite transporter